MSGIHRRRPAPIEMERSGQNAAPPQPRRCRGNRKCMLCRDTPKRHPPQLPRRGPIPRAARGYRCSTTHSCSRIPAPSANCERKEPHDTTANAARPARDVKHLPGRGRERNRNRVPKLSGSYRNPMVKYEPELHMSCLEHA
jgi:hypothetical protein